MSCQSINSSLLTALSLDTSIQVHCRGLTSQHSLKKFRLRMTSQFRQDILEKIGALPLLEKLKLNYRRFKGCKWETVEGRFQCLNTWKLPDRVYSNGQWKAPTFHALRTMSLLRTLYYLEEIPLEFAEIPTLPMIYSVFCRTCSINSAKSCRKTKGKLYGKVDLHFLLRLW